MSKRIIYAQGSPYGAPLCMVRGGATREPDVKALLRERGFTWDDTRHAWSHYLMEEQFKGILLELRALGCEVIPKAGMRESYIIDLDKEDRDA